MTIHFDYFRGLVDEINAIKSDLKTAHRRVSPPMGTYTAYKMIKQIALPINRVFKSKKYTQERSIEMFSYALKKLDLLIRELAFYDRDKLVASLQHFYNKLFILLPQNTAIQHELFDAEYYHNDNKKAPVYRGFAKWLQDYILFGYQQRDLERRWAYTPIQVIQQSIKFSAVSG